MLYVILPSIAFMTVYLSYLFDRFAPVGENPFYGYSPTYDFVTLDDPVVNLVTQVIGWGLQGFTIYLVIIWSRQHNKQFEQVSDFRR